MPTQQLRLVVVHGAGSPAVAKLIGAGQQKTDAIFVSPASAVAKLDRELALGRVAVVPVDPAHADAARYAYLASLPSKHRVSAWLIRLPAAADAATSATEEFTPQQLAAFARVIDVKAGEGEEEEVVAEARKAALAEPVQVQPAPEELHCFVPSRAAGLTKPQIRTVLEAQLGGGPLVSFTLQRNALSVSSAASASSGVREVELAGGKLALLPKAQWTELLAQTRKLDVLTGQVQQQQKADSKAEVTPESVHLAVSKLGYNATRVSVAPNASKVDIGCESAEMVAALVKLGQLQLDGGAASITGLQTRPQRQRAERKPAAEAVGAAVRAPRAPRAVAPRTTRARLQLPVDTTTTTFDKEPIKAALQGVDPTVAVQYRHNAKFCTVWLASEQLADAALASNALPGLARFQARSTAEEEEKAPQQPARFSVMIRNLPGDVTADHLRPVFQQFDPKVTLRIHRRVATVNFADEAVRDQVLGQNMLVNGITLEVSPVEPKQQTGARRGGGGRQPKPVAAKAAGGEGEEAKPKRNPPPPNQAGVIARSVQEKDKAELVQAVQSVGGGNITVIDATFTARACMLTLASREQAQQLLDAPPQFQGRKLSVKLWT